VGDPAFTTAFLATEEGLAALRPRGIVDEAIDGGIEAINTSLTTRVNEEKKKTRECNRMFPTHFRI